MLVMRHLRSTEITGSPCRFLRKSNSKVTRMTYDTHCNSCPTVGHFPNAVLPLLASLVVVRVAVPDLHATQLVALASNDLPKRIPRENSTSPLRSSWETIKRRHCHPKILQ